MPTKTILILGGYGGAGFPIARLLLQETDVRLILVARSLEETEKAAHQLKLEAEGEKEGRSHLLQIAARHADGYQLKLPAVLLRGIFKCKEFPFYLYSLANPKAVLRGMRSLSIFTAIPGVACLLQYLDGSLARPGLWMMGRLADPGRLMKDMRRMGIQIRVTR